MAEKDKKQAKKSGISPELLALMNAFEFRNLDSIDLAATTNKRQPELLQRMLQFLATGGNMPQIVMGSPGEGAVGAYYPDQNRIILGENTTNTLAHELAHAVESAGRLQGVDDKASQKIIEQFIDKLPQNTVTKLLGRSPTGMRTSVDEDYGNYRKSPSEAQAFGIGEQFYRGPDGSSAGHLNSTMATEFEIMLDLLTRRQQAMSQEKKK